MAVPSMAVLSMAVLYDSRSSPTGRCIMHSQVRFSRNSCKDTLTITLAYAYPQPRCTTTVTRGRIKIAAPTAQQGAASTPNAPSWHSLGSRRSSPPDPFQSAPGGSGQLGTPRQRPAHWTLSIGRIASVSPRVLELAASTRRQFRCRRLSFDHPRTLH